MSTTTGEDGTGGRRCRDCAAGLDQAGRAQRCGPCRARRTGAQAARRAREHHPPGRHVLTRRCPDCGEAFTVPAGRGAKRRRCPRCRRERQRAQARAYHHNRSTAKRARDRRNQRQRRRARRAQINHRRRAARAAARPRCARCARQYRAYRPGQRWRDHCKPCRKTAATELARELAQRLGHAPTKAEWDHHIHAPAAKVIHDWFGSWTALRAAAGLSQSPRPNQTKHATESIYLLTEQPLHPGERTYLKIGRATNPKTRLRAYRTHNPRPTTIIREIPCGPDARPTETALHKLLNAHHVRGEWFTTTAIHQLTTLTDTQIRGLADRLP